MERGEIYLARFPFGDVPGMKLRPVLLPTGTVGSVPEVLVAYISSVLPAQPLSSDLILDPAQPEFQTTNLKVPAALQLGRCWSTVIESVARMRKGLTRKPADDTPAVRLKNYITPSGLQRLKDEHRFLLMRERPAVTKVVAWAASNGDRSENADYQYGKRRLREIDRRIRFLSKRIDAAEVVDPETPRPGKAGTRVFFGATVRYAAADGAERVVRIVGTDEVDLRRNYISWVSPLARTLMKSAEGDRVVLRAPGGTEQLEILDVNYERIPMDPFQEPPGAESRNTR